MQKRIPWAQCPGRWIKMQGTEPIAIAQTLPPQTLAISPILWTLKAIIRQNLVSCWSFFLWTRMKKPVSIPRCIPNPQCKWMFKVTASFRANLGQQHRLLPRITRRSSDYRHAMEANQFLFLAQRLLQISTKMKVEHQYLDSFAIRRKACQAMQRRHSAMACAAEEVARW